MPMRTWLDRQVASLARAVWAEWKSWACQTAAWQTTCTSCSAEAMRSWTKCTFHRRQIWTCEKTGAEAATGQVPSRKGSHGLPMNFIEFLWSVSEFFGAESCSSALWYLCGKPGACEQSKACSQQRWNKAPCFWRRWVRLQQSMGPRSSGHLAWIWRSDNFAGVTYGYIILYESLWYYSILMYINYRLL